MILIETTNLLGVFGALQLSADVAILRTVVGLNAQPTISPELPFATEPMRGLHQCHQASGSNRTDAGDLAQQFHRAFRRAAYPMLVLFPGAVVCALAGEVGIPVRGFSALIVVRTLVAVVLIRMLGHAFARPIDDVLRFFDRWTLPATVASVAAVALYLVWERVLRRRRDASRGSSSSGGDL